jgi:hypothetical protein
MSCKFNNFIFNIQIFILFLLKILIMSNKEQLLVALKGKKDNELGLRYIEIERFWSEGWLIKSIIPLHTNEDGEITLQFLLERKVGS